MDHTARMVHLYRRRFEHYGHGSADQAIVGLGGQVFMRPNSQDAIREFRPYFDVAPVYGHGPSLEQYMRDTPLTVGSPQQVIERTLSFADAVGDYQRQMFLIDHAGLPLKTVLEQLDILGEEVVPVLRKEFEARRPAHVPSDPPTHATLLAAGPDHPNAKIGPERATVGGAR
jgi:alkanesulfonate monooxygenase SsuD/methylene tetrahydromethanopterin reductase-like flavin-dependent oxidoreductase (luciferase family)